MLPNLFKDVKVQKELKIFQVKIKQIQNSAVKKEAEILLKKLKEEIQILEDNHKSRLIGELRPSLYYINRENINDYRLKISKILHENGLK
jgi:hypothetical protein